MHASILQPNHEEDLSKLPPHATEASHIRYEAAQALVASAPHDLTRVYANIQESLRSQGLGDPDGLASKWE